MQAQLQEQEKEQHGRIAIHHYHCDHLGTPMALTDQTGQVAWAAKLDPWGNVLQEYNPQGIHQAIRLPGQHHDRETGLYYNRHRYYDPVVGIYVNQDPIGLSGGMNKSIYPLISLQKIDPLGLWASQKGAYVHQRAGYLVFGKEISQSQLSAVARGHVWADSAEHQTPEFSHMHAMRRPGQTKAGACAATNKFIKNESQKALNAKKSGDMDSALFHFGAALHTIQDATFPFHSGFQLWTGQESAAEILIHIGKESIVPSKDSSLFESAKKAWEAFKSGDINGFTCPCK